MANTNWEEAIKTFDDSRYDRELNYGFAPKPDKDENQRQLQTNQVFNRIVGTLAVFAALGFGIKTATGLDLNSGASKYEQATEACVSDLVGRDVDLVPTETGGSLQHPSSVIDEQFACEQNSNDPSQAKQNLHRVPVE